jgi:plasmid stabilization system protein ParE
MVKKQVIWPQKARLQLKEAYLFIKQDSPQNAEKVRKAILSSTNELTTHPKLHRPDKYKRDNDGSYRAYEQYSYRISYHVSNDKITIVRIRHTSMEPHLY